MWGNNLKVDPTKLPDKNGLRKSSQEGGLEPAPVPPKNNDREDYSKGRGKGSRGKRDDDYGDKFAGGRGKKRDRGDRDHDFGGRVRC